MGDLQNSGFLQSALLQQKSSQPLVKTLPHDLFHQEHKIREMAADQLSGILGYRQRFLHKLLIETGGDDPEFRIFFCFNNDFELNIGHNTGGRQDTNVLLKHPVNGDLPALLRKNIGSQLIRSGQLRAYVLSEEGREITIYRMFDQDVCILSASCIMPNIQFEIIIEAEKDTEFWVVPSCLYKKLMETSLPVARYTNDLLGSHFSEVMFLMEQVMWKSFDRRLAAFLLEESKLEGTKILKITHEKIANHMGTAREVVTRMLRYFQSENMVKLTRGAVELTDSGALELLAED